MKVEDYNEGWVRKQSPTKLITMVIGAIVALIVVIIALGVPLGWFKAGADIISPTNVKNQYAFAYGFDENLTASATQWCSYAQAENAAADPDIKSQRTSQRLAVEALYAANKAKYDAALENAFQAKWVKPADVPNRAPTLAEKTAVLCPDTKVATG